MPGTITELQQMLQDYYIALKTDDKSNFSDEQFAKLRVAKTADVE